MGSQALTQNRRLQHRRATIDQAPELQDNKETKPRTPTQQAAPEVPPKSPTTENQATNPKGKKVRNGNKNKAKNPGKDDPQAQTSVAGQQTADAGTSGGEPEDDAKGDITENKGDSSKGDHVKAQSEAKSGTTEEDAEAGRKTEGAGDAQAAKTNGSGDAQTSNGDDAKGDAEKNKTKNMQQTTKGSSQQGTLAIDVSNNVTNGGDGNSGGQRGSSVPKSTTQIGSGIISSIWDNLKSV